MFGRNIAILIAISLFFSGLAIGFGLSSQYHRSMLQEVYDGISKLEDEINELGNPRYSIGIVYPLSGRLDWWGRDALPIIDAAEADLKDLLERTGSKAKINFLLADSGSTPEGAIEAVGKLVEEGAQIIVGLPTSGELGAVMEHFKDSKIPIISSASTASHLSKPDRVYRLSTPENYRAVAGAKIGIELGCTRVVAIYRDDEWGRGYAETVTKVFGDRGLESHSITFETSHTFYMNYSREVEELRKFALSGDNRTLVYLVAWENEDYSILSEARKVPELSGIRWISAALYPSILEKRTMWGKAEDLRDFAMTVGLIAPEQRPIVCDLTVKLMEEAKSKLGHYPSYEHMYLYDSIMIASQAILLSGGDESGSLAEAIPIVAERYFGATGHKKLDENGDLLEEDTAFIGVVRVGDAYEFGYLAFHDGLRDEFTFLERPQERHWFFSPQA